MTNKYLILIIIFFQTNLEIPQINKPIGKNIFGISDFSTELTIAEAYEKPPITICDQLVSK